MFALVPMRNSVDTKGCVLVNLELKYKRFEKYKDGLRATTKELERIARCIIEEFIREQNHATRQ